MKQGAKKRTFEYIIYLLPENVNLQSGNSWKKSVIMKELRRGRELVYVEVTAISKTL